MLALLFKFQVAECQFKGSWAANFVGFSTSIAQQPSSVSETVQIVKEQSSHDVHGCLLCMDISQVTGLHVTREVSVGANDGTAAKSDTRDKNVIVSNGRGNGKSDTLSSAGILEKFVKGKRSDTVLTPKEHDLIKREILRLVVSLSSAVTSKSHQQSLRRYVMKSLSLCAET